MWRILKAPGLRGSLWRTRSAGGASTARRVVHVDITDCKDLLAELEGEESVRAYDAAKTSGDEAAYSKKLDHFQSPARFTRPRRTGFRWDVLNRLPILSHPAECAIRETPLPELASFAPAVVDGNR